MSKPVAPIRLVIRLASAALIASALHAASALDVPLGRAPLLDQNAAPSEWKDAARVELPDGAALFMKADLAHLYLAIIPAQPAVFGADLFVQDVASGEQLDLHASSYLGERSRKDDAWPEWEWWNNRGWAATVAPYQMKEGRLNFVPAQAKIFQLSRTRFSAPSYRIRITYRLARDQPETVFPAGSSNVPDEGWLTLHLPAPESAARKAEEAQESVGAFTAISVVEIERSIAWYRDTLGFNVHASGTEPERNIRFALLIRGNAMIELLQFPDAKSRSEVAPSIREARLLHGFFKAGFVVADIDGLYAELKRRNVPFAYSLAQPPNGPYRAFALRDPDQNLVQIFGR